MTVHASQNGLGVTSVGAMPLVQVCQTRWGYAFSCETAISGRAALIERVCGLTGMSFLAIAAGHWFFPQVHAGVGDEIEVQMMASAAMAISGLLFLWISVRGLRSEVQVDLENRRVNHAVCNRNGRSRVLRSAGFDEIGSAFVQRSKERGVPAKLFVRLGEGREVMEVARGREATLTALHHRLCDDMHPAPPQRPAASGPRRVRARRPRPLRAAEPA